MTTRASQACQGCRLRKVKCNGQKPCQQCSHLNLPCNFTSPSTQRKNSARGRRLAQLKSSINRGPKQLRPATETISPLSAGFSEGESPNRPFSSYSTGNLSTTPQFNLFGDAGLAKNDDCIYNDDFFLGLLPKYVDSVYPVNPILTAADIQRSIDLRHVDAEHAALAFAYAAVTINLTHTTVWSLPGGVNSRLRDLVSRSLAAKRIHDAQLDADFLLENHVGGNDCKAIRPTITRIMTCIFLEICFMMFKDNFRAFNILREAAAMMQLLMVDITREDDKRGEEGSQAEGRSPALSSTSKPSDPAYRGQLERLYWEIYIHERFTTVMTCLPSILRPLASGPPAPDPAIPLHVDVGFSHLVRLFLIVDDDFMGYWIETAAKQSNKMAWLAPTAPMTVAWVQRKQRELDEHEMAYSTAVLEPCDVDDEHGGGPRRTSSLLGDFPILTELQRADLSITRLWLRTMVWQLAMSRCLLTSAPSPAAHAGLSLLFPVERLGAELRQLVAALESIDSSIGFHGSGILEKLFEITNTIADVMLLLPAVAPVDKREDIDALSAVAGDHFSRQRLPSLDEQSRFSDRDTGEIVSADNCRLASPLARRWNARQQVADFLVLVRILVSFERMDSLEKKILRLKVHDLERLFPEAHEEFSRTDIFSPPSL